MAEFLVTDKLTGSMHAPIPSNRINQTINYLGPHCSEELGLIRILLGTVSIEHARTGTRWDQSQDYSVLGAPKSCITSRGELEAELSNRGLELNALNTHLRSNLKQSTFYSELCGEILYSSFHNERGAYTLGFLHIYRFLERISFAFPLIYSARSKDFKSAYTALKEFIEGGDKGELNFFKKFVETSIDSVLREATTTLDFTGADPQYRAKIYAKVKQFVPSDCLVSEVLNDSLEIKNLALIPLLVQLRNRFFHFLSSNPENLTTSDVPDSDAFFSCLNMPFKNWLAVIYFEVLRHNLRSW